ncbi:hypothetical protein FHG87_022172 [Trinorchestia longiramus]|nr:hypothetical protein FHG87_022172 [Trinorchestia longiramus]
MHQMGSGGDQMHQLGSGGDQMHQLGSGGDQMHQLGSGGDQMHQLRSGGDQMHQLYCLTLVLNPAVFRAMLWPGHPRSLTQHCQGMLVWRKWRLLLQARVWYNIEATHCLTLYKARKGSLGKVSTRQLVQGKVLSPDAAEGPGVSSRSRISHMTIKSGAAVSAQSAVVASRLITTTSPELASKTGEPKNSDIFPPHETDSPAVGQASPSQNKVLFAREAASVAAKSCHVAASQRPTRTLSLLRTESIAGDGEESSGDSLADYCRQRRLQYGEEIKSGSNFACLPEAVGLLASILDSQQILQVQNDDHETETNTLGNRLADVDSIDDRGRRATQVAANGPNQRDSRKKINMGDTAGIDSLVPRGRDHQAATPSAEDTMVSQLLQVTVPPDDVSHPQGVSHPQDVAFDTLLDSLLALPSGGANNTSLKDTFSPSDLEKIGVITHQPKSEGLLSNELEPISNKPLLHSHELLSEEVRLPEATHISSKEKESLSPTRDELKNIDKTTPLELKARQRVIEMTSRLSKEVSRMLASEAGKAESHSEKSTPEEADHDHPSKCHPSTTILYAASNATQASANNWPCEEKLTRIMTSTEKTFGTPSHEKSGSQLTSSSRSSSGDVAESDRSSSQEEGDHSTAPAGGDLLTELRTALRRRSGGGSPVHKDVAPPPKPARRAALQKKPVQADVSSVHQQESPVHQQESPVHQQESPVHQQEYKQPPRDAGQQWTNKSNGWSQESGQKDDASVHDAEETKRVTAPTPGQNKVRKIQALETDANDPEKSEYTVEMNISNVQKENITSRDMNMSEMQWRVFAEEEFPREEIGAQKDNESRKAYNLRYNYDPKTARARPRPKQSLQQLQQQSLQQQQHKLVQKQKILRSQPGDVREQIDHERGSVLERSSGNKRSSIRHENDETRHLRDQIERPMDQRQKRQNEQLPQLQKAQRYQINQQSQHQEPQQGVPSPEPTGLLPVQPTASSSTRSTRSFPTQPTASTIIQPTESPTTRLAGLRTADQEEHKVHPPRASGRESGGGRCRGRPSLPPPPPPASSLPLAGPDPSAAPCPHPVPAAAPTRGPSPPVNQEGSLSAKPKSFSPPPPPPRSRAPSPVGLTQQTNQEQQTHTKAPLLQKLQDEQQQQQQRQHQQQQQQQQQQQYQLSQQQKQIHIEIQKSPESPQLLLQSKPEPETSPAVGPEGTVQCAGQPHILKDKAGEHEEDVQAARKKLKEQLEQQLQQRCQQLQTEQYQVRDSDAQRLLLRQQQLQNRNKPQQQRKQVQRTGTKETTHHESRSRTKNIPPVPPQRKSSLTRSSSPSSSSPLQSGATSPQLPFYQGSARSSSPPSPPSEDRRTPPTSRMGYIATTSVSSSIISSPVSSLSPVSPPLTLTPHLPLFSLAQNDPKQAIISSLQKIAPPPLSQRNSHVDADNNEPLGKTQHECLETVRRSSNDSGRDYNVPDLDDKKTNILPTIQNKHSTVYAQNSPVIKRNESVEKEKTTKNKDGFSMSISWPIQMIPKDSFSPATQAGEFVRISTLKEGKNGKTGTQGEQDCRSTKSAQDSTPHQDSTFFTPGSGSTTPRFRSFSPVNFNAAADEPEKLQALITNPVNQLGSSDVFRMSPGSAHRIYGSHQDVSSGGEYASVGPPGRFNTMREGRISRGLVQDEVQRSSTNLESFLENNHKSSFGSFAPVTNDLKRSYVSIDTNEGSDSFCNFNIKDEDGTEKLTDAVTTPDSCSDNGANDNVTSDATDQTSDSIQMDVCESVDSGNVVSGYVRCRNPSCNKVGDTEELRVLFKNCHNCGSSYCSRVCRRSHWEKHKKVCQKIRANNAAREIVSMVRDKEVSLDAASAVGRRGALGLGRGVVKMFFPDIPSAESFVEGNYTPSMHYHAASNLMPNEMSPDVYRSLMEMCRTYNSDYKFILYVSICVNSEITSGPSKCKRENVSRAAKIKLFDPPKTHDKQTSTIFRSSADKPASSTFRNLDKESTRGKELGMRLLTFAPDTKEGGGHIERQKTPTAPFRSPLHYPNEEEDEDDTQELTAADSPETLLLTPLQTLQLSARESRQVCVQNILRHLRQRQVFLRTQHPDVYRKLSIYADSGETFPPMIIHPRHPQTGITFECIIMPQQDPQQLNTILAQNRRVCKVDVLKAPLGDA